MHFFAHATVVIDEGCSIGNGTAIWHFSHIMAGAVIGDNCNIGQNVVVSPDVVLGHHVKVQNNVSLYTGVICEDYVFIGPSAVFTNVINPRSAINRKHEFRSTRIKKGATVGANATIICGNEIGAYAMIGAGAVVTTRIKNYELVVGNPAYHKGWVSEFGHTLEFKNGKGICPESLQEYILEGDELTRIK
jgi:UDP-2-acetamido-3-amino-2,3-dideoxy-glucuronate N-acetyltransferase